MIKHVFTCDACGNIFKPDLGLKSEARMIVVSHTNQAILSGVGAATGPNEAMQHACGDKCCATILADTTKRLFPPFGESDREHTAHITVARLMGIL